MVPWDLSNFKTQLWGQSISKLAKSLLMIKAGHRGWKFCSKNISTQSMEPLLAESQTNDLSYQS